MNFQYMPPEFFVICAGIFGAAAGSFFHVCVWRIPRELSIVMPGSHCPACDTPIRWYDNIPMISYLLLGGACRNCHTRIPIRYPLYELLTSLLFMGVVYEYHFSLTSLLYLVIVSDLIIASGIDWDHQYIPDSLSLPMIPLSVVIAALGQWLNLFPGAMVDTVLGSLLGIVTGGGVIWAIRIIGTWYFKQEAMGFGDVKLMAFLGGFLGWNETLLCIFTGAFLGSIVGLLLKFSGKIGKYGHIPFGPYLAMGAYICLMVGPEIIDWYAAPFRLGV